MIPMKIGARGWYVMLIRGAGGYDTYGKLRHGKLVKIGRASCRERVYVLV